MQREHPSWFPSEDKIPYRPCPSSVVLADGPCLPWLPHSVPVALLEVLHGAAVHRASSLAAGPNRALAREATVAVAAAEIGDSPQACETDWRNTMERIRQAEHARALSGFLANVSRFLGCLKGRQVELSRTTIPSTGKNPGPAERDELVEDVRSWSTCNEPDGTPGVYGPRCCCGRRRPPSAAPSPRCPVKTVQPLHTAERAAPAIMRRPGVHRRTAARHEAPRTSVREEVVQRVTTARLRPYVTASWQHLWFWPRPPQCQITSLARPATTIS